MYLDGEGLVRRGGVDDAAGSNCVVGACEIRCVGGGIGAEDHEID